MAAGPYRLRWRTRARADAVQNFYGCICPGGLSGCHYAPNYQGVHAYQTDFTSFQNLVTSYYNEFGLDIVVGEFAWAVSLPPQSSPPQLTAVELRIQPPAVPTDSLRLHGPDHTVAR